MRKEEGSQKLGEMVPGSLSHPHPPASWSGVLGRPEDRGPLGPRSLAQRWPSHGEQAGKRFCSHLALKGTFPIPLLLVLTSLASLAQGDPSPPSHLELRAVPPRTLPTSSSPHGQGTDPQTSPPWFSPDKHAVLLSSPTQSLRSSLGTGPKRH